MRTITRQDVQPAFRALFFEEIEARHLIGYPSAFDLDTEVLFIAGKDNWEKRVIKIPISVDEEADEYEILNEGGNPSDEHGKVFRGKL